jgi:iron complex outermembrane receptor protein
MKNLRTRKVSAVLSLVAIAGLLTNTGIAQTTTTTTTTSTAATPAPENTEVLQAYTVTGTYLPVSATVTASPVVTVEASDIGASGATDPLRLLRQLTPFFAGNGNQGTEANNGAAGESYVALRNLTTLVLIDGQRITGSPFQSGTLVDLNTIPTAMIDRIEVLKDGASTIYGTDAIGGVVNIILKKNYNGFEMGADYGTTDNGDYKTRSVYILGGASGDGYSLTVGAEHFENSQLDTTSRPIALLSGTQISAMGFNTTSAVYSGTYPGRVGSDVLAGSTLIAAGATGFNAAITSPGIKSSPNAAPYGVGAAALAQLVAMGVYIPAATTPAGEAVGGSATALNTADFGNPLMTPTRRNQFIANGDKELFGKSFVVFGDFLFAQTINAGSGLAPTPIAGVGPAGANSLTIPANDPYNVFDTVFPGVLSARTRTIELGHRYSTNETNTWRFVGGFKGDINPNYNWSVTYDYSRASLLEQIFGGVNGANMNLAMIPEISATGGYVYNAAGKPLSMLTDSSGNNLPVYNFFALPGFNDPTTLAALETVLFQSGTTSMRNIQAIFAGTPFALPAGDFSFDIGGESRREDLTTSVDGLFANGLAIGYNPANTFAGGERASYGAWAEVGVPLVSPKMNIPGVYTLSLNAADRYESIKPGGSASSPKIGVRWLPFDDSFVIRATAAQGFIAPSIVNLFGPATGNSPTITLLQGNGAITTGGSGGSLNSYTTIQGSANQLSNPNLQAAKSNSVTMGFVYSPKQVKGLSITVDYYKISQTGGVGNIDFSSVVSDLNAKGSGSIYAKGFVFADGSSLVTTAPNQVNALNFGEITVTQNPSGDQTTDGLDIAIDYRFSTDTLGRWDLGASANVLFNYKFRTDPGSPYYQYARNYSDTTDGLGGTNGLLPGYIIKPYINNVYGPVTTNLYLNYIPATTDSFAENLNNIQGGGLVDPDTISGKPYKIPSYFTADLSFTYQLPNFGQAWAKNMTLTVGANNVFNKKPPYVPVDGNPPGENNTVESMYDIIGRFLFVSLKKDF